MIKEFSVCCSQTINLGNYESMKVEAMVLVSVPPDAADDDRAWPTRWKGLKENAQSELRLLLEETYKAQVRKRGSA